MHPLTFPHWFADGAMATGGNLVFAPTKPECPQNKKNVNSVMEKSYFYSGVHLLIRFVFSNVHSYSQ